MRAKPDFWRDYPIYLETAGSDRLLNYSIDQGQLNFGEDRDGLERKSDADSRNVGSFIYKNKSASGRNSIQNQKEENQSIRRGTGQIQSNLDPYDRFYRDDEERLDRNREDKSITVTQKISEMIPEGSKFAQLQRGQNIRESFRKQNFEESEQRDPKETVISRIPSQYDLEIEGIDGGPEEQNLEDSRNANLYRGARERDQFDGRIQKEDKKFLQHPLYGANVDRRDIISDPPDIDDDVLDQRSFKPPPQQFDVKRQNPENYFYNRDRDFDPSITNGSDQFSHGFDDMQAFENQMNKMRGVQ